jgi:hypothetical protein
MENHIAQNTPPVSEAAASEAPADDRSKDEKKADDAELYNISNFSV